MSNLKRAIKFRGKIGGNWHFVTPDDFGWKAFWEMVDRKTVGQFTELLDKNGQEMYDGDIVSRGNPNFTFLLVWSVLHARWSLRSNFRGTDGETIWNALRSEKNEVIGNVYDNPELRRH